ncbi:MAG TPA: histidine--tRNA ligase [Candidatus Limnocylindrales bacterium]
MPIFRAPRGTRDVLPSERPAFARLERIASELAGRYGYEQIEPPMFEQAGVFERGIGDATDVVEKELFRVSPSRGEERERWALRPEATAGICRAYIEHGMHTLPQPVKLTFTGSMFRYDRPQAGRYRQFWQWDVESIGDPGPAVDAEIVELASRFYADVGLPVEIQLNSIGDLACRPAYLDELGGWYRDRVERLPAPERERLERNPLRLLDSKDPAMVALNAEAPKLADRLCAACREHFAEVRAHLDLLGVAYRLEAGLVRGLDYYTRTAFEVFPVGAHGQQSAVGGGGRYDGLIELLGGKPTPGIGFALGLDRIVLALGDSGGTERRAPLAIVVGADPAATGERLRIATELRTAGLSVSADLGHRKLGRQLEAAVKAGARLAIIVGDETAEGLVQVRDLGAASQKPVPLADLPALLGRKSPR